MRAVKVPAGSHLVSFVFTPAVFFASVYVSIAAAAVTPGSADLCSQSSEGGATATIYDKIKKTVKHTLIFGIGSVVNSAFGLVLVPSILGSCPSAPSASCRCSPSR